MIQESSGTDDNQMFQLKDFHPLGYERVYLTLYKVADTPFLAQGDAMIYISLFQSFIGIAQIYEKVRCLNNSWELFNVTFNKFQPSQGLKVAWCCG